MLNFTPVLKCTSLMLEHNLAFPHAILYCSLLILLHSDNWDFLVMTIKFTLLLIYELLIWFVSDKNIGVVASHAWPFVSHVDSVATPVAVGSVVLPDEADVAVGWVGFRG